jgi:hypothetical protein
MRDRREETRRFGTRVRRDIIALVNGLAALTWLVVTSSVAAQESAREPIDTRIGHSTDALPGYLRVAVPRTVPWPVAVAVTGGYGFTESVLDAEDSHHRLMGRIAVSAQPIDYLAVGLRFDGRYDTHSVGDTNDDGLVGDPRLTLRGWYPAGIVTVGAEATVWFPGADAPSLEIAATTVDLRALGAFEPSDDLTLALNAGYRIDQSAESVERPDLLSGSDRISLGLSASSAVLLGVGVGFRTGPVELFAEWSWDVLVGSDAPDLGASPMRVGAGAHVFVGELHPVQLTAQLDVLLSSRPDVAATAPLAPVEPRFAITLGAAFRFPVPDAASELGEGDDPGERIPDGIETGTVSGRVLDGAGQPLAGAHVSAQGSDQEFSVQSGDDGRYTLRLPVGRYRLTIRADGFGESAQDLEVGGGERALEPVSLARDVSAQIRGVIQSFRGDAVTATVRVEPLGTEVETDAEGFFQVDVPPGDYEVVIRADGFEEQRRPVHVDEEGVTIINADLRRD